MRFELPQFIETETKLVGPFTLKQFLWIAGGASLSYILFLWLKLTIWFFITAVPIAASAVALAFVNIDGTPLFNYILYAINYTFASKRYLFRKNDDKIKLPYN